VIAYTALVAFIASNNLATETGCQSGEGVVSRKEETVTSSTGETADRIAIQSKDQREIKELYEKLREAAPKLVGPDGKTEVLPNNVYSFLCRVLADLKAGNSVTILQSNAQLTTMDASKMLGVSRQFLVGLLEKGEIPFHKVGTHRRVYARDVLAFKARRDAARRKALDDLTRAESEEGIYEKVPDDLEPGKRVRRTA
jgi:excisionase family DNA binding protein